MHINVQYVFMFIYKWRDLKILGMEKGIIKLLEEIMKKILEGKNIITL